jgi:hypothetical protein
MMFDTNTCHATQLKIVAEKSPQHNTKIEQGTEIPPQATI